MSLPKFITTAELAETLQVSESKVIKMREDGTGPAFVVIGRAIRYPPRSIQEWLDSCKQVAPTPKRVPRRSKGTPRSSSPVA